MQCFCGCGQTVPFRLRRTNKSGRRLRRDVYRVEQLLGIGLVSPNATVFVQQANEWCELFASAVHARIKPDDEQPGMRRIYLAWLSQATPYLNVGQLGKRIRAAGLTADDAMELIRAGEFDPFADAVMPIPNQ